MVVRALSAITAVAAMLKSPKSSGESNRAVMTERPSAIA
jgi:hypothetical protein